MNQEKCIHSHPNMGCDSQLARTTLENPRSSDRTFYTCILKHILIKFFREDEDDHGAGGSYDANLEQRVQVSPCVSSSYPC
jgi:hypothetical protein